MHKSERFWNRMASRYDGDGDDLDEGSRKLVENIRKHLTSDDVVLDFACATGTYSLELAAHVQSVHGIDISAKMIEIAKGKAADRNIENVSFARATIFDDDLKDESFDAILALNILHLLENRPETIQRINQLLKPGGFFISTTACLGEKRSVLGLFIMLLSKTPFMPYVKPLKSSDLVESMTQRGFQIVETETVLDVAPNVYIVARKG